MGGGNDEGRAGKRYGRLVALKHAEGSAEGSGGWWLCRCDCGREVVVRDSGLDAGSVRSCGQCGGVARK